MPVKRKRGRPLKKQESQKIRTRLIEISLKVEDYIYQKIPISMVEAESFITEVTSYKPACSEDEKSLQVIEKLIRCMKAIIIEHEESRTGYCDINEELSHVDSGTTSPVYSLPDENKTHMTQELLEPSSGNFFNEPTSQNDNRKHNEEIDNVADNDSTVKAIILHCDSNEDDISIVTTETSFARSKKSLDVDIQKALSNLSLENVDQEERALTDIECSQSILNNFHELDKMQQNLISNVEFTKTRVTDDAIKTDAGKTSQFQTINLLTKKIVNVNDANRIVKAINVPSSNIATGDLNKKTTKPVIAKHASRKIRTKPVPSSNANTVDLTNTSTKPLVINATSKTIKGSIVSSANVNITSTKSLTINDISRTIKGTVASSSNVVTVDLTNSSTKPLTMNDISKTIKGSIVSSSNVNITSTKPLTINDTSKTIKGSIVSPSYVDTIDLTNSSTKPFTINDARRTIKGHPSSNEATAGLNSNKQLIITDASGNAKAKISRSPNVTAVEKNKPLKMRNPPLPNVSNQNNKVNSPKTYAQNVAEHFANTFPTNTIYTNPITYNNTISSTNYTSNSYEHYKAGSTCKKNLEIKSTIQENIASTNPCVKKKRGPRKNNVKKKTEKLSNDETNNKVIKKKIRKARSKKVNAECNLIPKDSTVPIYNNFIENDLSWLENIRFVREIRDDEIDSKLTYLSENFWDNYDLPPNFDEVDFL